MNLPPILLQRLAQRGLVQTENAANVKHLKTATDESEEIIAEDYDELTTNMHYQKKKRTTDESFWRESIRKRMVATSSFAGYISCPNKYNIWHKCTLYCVNRWKEGRQEPNREYLSRYKRLLLKYPLPKDWQATYDPGCSCFFFSNVSNNMVSWLPPTHPKSIVSKSAAAYRKQMGQSNFANNSDSEQCDQEHLESLNSSGSRCSPINQISSYDI